MGQAERGCPVVCLLLECDVTLQQQGPETAAPAVGIATHLRIDSMAVKYVGTFTKPTEGETCDAKEKRRVQQPI